MTSETTSKVAISCAVVEAAVVLTSEKDDRKKARSLIAIAVLAIAIGMIADVAPEVAGPFAILVLVAMLANYRGQIGNFLGFGRG